jgi:hypothetical protein
MGIFGTFDHACARTRSKYRSFLAKPVLARSTAIAFHKLLLCTLVDAWCNFSRKPNSMARIGRCNTWMTGCLLRELDNSRVAATGIWRRTGALLRRQKIMFRIYDNLDEAAAAREARDQGRQLVRTRGAHAHNSEHVFVDGVLGMEDGGKPGQNCDNSQLRLKERPFTGRNRHSSGCSSVNHISICVANDFT